MTRRTASIERSPALGNQRAGHRSLSRTSGPEARSSLQIALPLTTYEPQDLRVVPGGQNTPGLRRDRVGSGLPVRLADVGLGCLGEQLVGDPTQVGIRWPQSASRRIARRCSASSSTIASAPLRPRTGSAPRAPGQSITERSSAIARAIRCGEGRAVLRGGADHRQPLREPPAGRPLGLEQRPQREQIVGERLERRQPLAAHLKARQRPAELAAARGRRATRP